jgi:hypothetical protein
MAKTLLSYAIEAAVGWHVFPARPGTKIPLVKWGDEATCDLAKIVEWWTRWPMANIGIAVKPSGLVVIDTDTLRDGETIPKEFADLGIHDGEDQLAYLAETLGDGTWDWLKTYTVRTPSNGLHRYFQAPTTPPIVANSQPLYGCYKLDVRGGGDTKGGIVFAAGSRNAAGAPYKMALDYNVGAMPTWLQARCAVRPPTLRTSLPRTATARQGDIPEALLKNLAKAPQGEHASLIYWSARQCLNMGIPEDAAIQALLDVALSWRESKHGWSYGRVATAVRSAYSRPARSA